MAVRKGAQSLEAGFGRDLENDELAGVAVGGGVWIEADDLGFFVVSVAVKFRSPA